MEVQYFEEERFYLISNYAVAKNPIFLDREIQDHFRSKLDFYLSEICEVKAIRFSSNEFRMVVRIKEKEAFDIFKNTKYGKPSLLNPERENTHVFSQQMSNLQVSLVKKVNKKFNRRGGLMAGRFARFLLATPEEIIEAIEETKSVNFEDKHVGIWKNEMGLLVPSFLEVRGFDKSEFILEKRAKDRDINEASNDLVGDMLHGILTQNSFLINYHQNQLYNFLGKILC